MPSGRRHARSTYEQIVLLSAARLTSNLQTPTVEYTLTLHPIPLNPEPQILDPIPKA